MRIQFTENINNQFKKKLSVFNILNMKYFIYLEFLINSPGTLVSMIHC